MPVEGIQLQGYRQIKIEKIYQENVIVSNYSLFVVSRDCVIQLGEISWDRCEITLVEISEEGSSAQGTLVSEKNMEDKESSHNIGANDKSVDSLSQLLYQEIDEILVKCIQSSRFYLGEFHLKGLIGGQSIHLVGQSLHIQGESKQAMGVYLKSLEGYLEKTKIFGVSKLILVCPFGELHMR